MLDDLLGLAPAVIAPDAVSSDAHDDDSASVSPSGAVNSAEAADNTTDAADSGHAGNRPTQPLPSLPSFPIPRATPVKLAGTPRRFSSSRIPRRRCSRSATRPSSRTPTICCSAAADTRAMTRESLSITARRASTYAKYSIGDYVLNGGEVAVSVMLEAITRLLPGFMGNPDSIVEESYTGGNALLEHHQYTKPATWRGIAVPPILTSGDHGKVDRFRRDEALTRTNDIRPDLIEQLDCRQLDKQDRKTLIALGWEVSGARPRKLK